MTIKLAWLPVLIKRPSFPYTFSVLASDTCCHSASSLTMCGPCSISIVPASVSRSYPFVQLLKTGTVLGLIDCSRTWWKRMILYLIRCICPFRNTSYSQTIFHPTFQLGWLYSTAFFRGLVTYHLAWLLKVLDKSCVLIIAELGSLKAEDLICKFQSHKSSRIGTCPSMVSHL